jgi:hypothetical protein
MGAQEGLIRYDGYNFKRFANISFNSTSLLNVWVTCFEEDNEGNLWIATWGDGLNYFDQEKKNLPTIWAKQMHLTR